ncbi:MAG: response regulator transcription factor [Thermoanaerobaculia bacterium]|nr:response regulator transcription factor [Thermoanaerobaculia bacterium]
METKRVLIVEDERELAELVRLHLEDLGCDVSLAHDGAEGLDLALSGTFDLVVLDLMLPRLDGLEICRRLRQAPSYTPILMLTAKSTELDRVLGLEVGADDYLTKPFSIRELTARVKAIFRRVEALGVAREEDGRSLIEVGGFCIDKSRRTATLTGRELQLTAKEFDLLAHFARHPGRVYRRAELLDRVWGYGHDGYEHTVNSHINRLRAKIEDDPSEPRYVLTVWGVGYKFFDGRSFASGGNGAQAQGLR